MPPSAQRQQTIFRSHQPLISNPDPDLHLLSQPQPTHTMLAKYDIEYVIQPQHNKRVDTHRTDDPIEAEDFLMSLLTIGARIGSIKHEGVELERLQADRMLRVAAERLASRLLGGALNADAAEIKHRFGFSG
jgi:hypothetical protein